MTGVSLFTSPDRVSAASGKALKLALLLGMIGTVASGCTQVALPEGAITSAPTQTKLAIPDQSEQIASSLEPSYLIGAMDLLTVTVVGFPEFGGEAQVDFAGNIQLPLVGTVRAAGLSPEDLTRNLTVAFDNTYLKNPQVSIAVKEVKSRFVTVEGAVKQPGLYPLPTKLTLSSAISMAQGSTEFASLEKIAVFRTVKGQKMAAIFSLKDIRRGVYADPDIFSGDVVVVGDSAVRRVFRDIIQTAPFIAVFRPFG